MSATPGRFERLLLIISILQQRPGVIAAELAERVGVSERSLFRDLQTLRKAGVPVVHDKVGYRLGDEFLLPKLALNGKERDAFRLLPDILRNMANQPQLRDALHAIHKIEESLPFTRNGNGCNGNGGRPGSTLGYISFRRPDTGIVNDDEQWFAVLAHAIEEARLCRIRYQPAGQMRGEVAEFEPLHLHFWNRAWYVIAFSRLHKMRRMLKLTRISEIQLLGEGFKRDESFSIDEYLGNAWGLQSYDQDVRVVVHFSPLVAQNVTEVVWHRTQQNREQPDGSVILEFVVSGIQEISWWIAGYGDQAFVVEPMVLRNRLRDMFARLGEMYRGGVDPARMWRAHVRAGKKAEKKAEKRVGERSEFASKSKPAGQGDIGDADIVVRQDLPVRQGEVFGKPTSGE